MGSGSLSRMAEATLIWLLALEGALTHRHLVEDGAESKNVRAKVGFFAFDLFGSHVLNGADNTAGSGQRAYGRGAAHGARGG